MWAFCGVMVCKTLFQIRRVATIKRRWIVNTLQNASIEHMVSIDAREDRATGKWLACHP